MSGKWKGIDGGWYETAADAIAANKKYIQQEEQNQLINEQNKLKEKELRKQEETNKLLKEQTELLKRQEKQILAQELKKEQEKIEIKIKNQQEEKKKQEDEDEKVCMMFKISYLTYSCFYNKLLETISVSNLELKKKSYKHNKDIFSFYESSIKSLESQKSIYKQNIEDIPGFSANENPYDILYYQIGYDEIRKKIDNEIKQEEKLIKFNQEEKDILNNVIKSNNFNLITDELYKKITESKKIKSKITELKKMKKELSTSIIAYIIITIIIILTLFLEIDILFLILLIIYLLSPILWIIFYWPKYYKKKIKLIDEIKKLILIDGASFNEFEKIKTIWKKIPIFIDEEIKFTKKKYENLKQKTSELELEINELEIELDKKIKTNIKKFNDFRSSYYNEEMELFYSKRLLLRFKNQNLTDHFYVEEKRKGTKEEHLEFMNKFINEH